MLVRHRAPMAVSLQIDLNRGSCTKVGARRKVGRVAEKIKF